jgi:hypothetical protein
VSQRIKTKAFPALPLYHNFSIQLKGEELEQLKVLSKEYGPQDYVIPKDLVNGWGGDREGYEIDKIRVPARTPC